jgi:hypothetical protein
MNISPVLPRRENGTFDAWFTGTPQELIGTPQRRIILDRVGVGD